jgi:hypothetical protein
MGCGAAIASEHYLSITTEIGVPNMPSLKAKKLSELPREKVLLER